MGRNRVIILDTCGLLWLAAGRPVLSAQTLARLDEEPIVAVSAISAFEIGLKWLTRKLELPVPVREWWDGVVSHHGLQVLPVDASVAFRATELPPIHRDPADRFIIATAQRHGAAVVTSDGRFAGYGVEVLL